MHPEVGQFFYLATQGCKVNQYESQALREMWTARGALEIHDPVHADLVVINSCAVTQRALLDLGKMVRTFAALVPKPKIIVLGCAVQGARETILAIPGVDQVLDSKEKNFWGAPVETQQGFSNLQISNYHRARAILKVQDGCSHGCTYCIIPQTRGPSRSRAFEEILAEAKRLLAAGLRELTISGINLRHYGRDLIPKMDLWDLVQQLDQALSPQWAGLARLRLSSLEPGDLHLKTLETLGHCQMLCPHLHLSLQSGSPWILKRMGRGHYSPTQVFEFLKNLRQIWPVFGLGADIIAGFPGETDELFAETLEVVKALPLSYAHVFPYSERPGTAAINFPDSVPDHIRRQRAKILRQKVQHWRMQFLKTMLTIPQMQVIFENKNSGVNEFYIECQGERPITPSKDLTMVSPLAVVNEQLIVAIPKEHP